MRALLLLVLLVVLVGGGLTPAYHLVLQPHVAVIRVAVTDGLPYAGFSAGARAAATSSREKTSG